MPRNGLKWTYYDSDVLAAWVAEMDYGLAPAISDALHRAVDDGLTGYPYPQAEKATAEAATRFWRKRFDWQVPAEHVFAVPDVIEGVRRAIVHLTRPGSPVVLASPVYFPFYSMVERAGRDIIEVRCRPDEDGVYRLNLEAIDRAFDEGAGSLVLCDPWNPTGRSFTGSELDEVSEVARKHDVRILHDSIHGALTYPSHEHSPLAATDPERVVTVTSASKAWNLPGLKCGQVILTNDSDREKWSSYFTAEKVGVSTFGLIAAEAAYRDGSKWLDGVLEKLTSNRALLTDLIGDLLPRAIYRPPEATYLAWIDLGNYGVDDPAKYLLERARVGLTAGGPFGTGAERHVRFNFATDEDVITESIGRMANALETL